MSRRRNRVRRPGKRAQALLAQQRAAIAAMPREPVRLGGAIVLDSTVNDVGDLPTRCWRETP
jgi:hypothetical protein